MKQGFGKSKGSAFERQICKLLSLWVSGGQQEDLFWRSAMSGGRSTVAFKSGKGLRRQAGDLSAVAPEGHVLTDHFYVECKHVRSLEAASFFVSGTGSLAKYWAVAVAEAEKYQRAPMLIAKQNFMPTLLLVGARLDGLRRAEVHSTQRCCVYRLDDVIAYEFSQIIEALRSNA